MASNLKTLEGLISAMGMADRIKEAMGTMSPADLARACKVTAASVTFWLDGRTRSLRAEKATLMEAATGYRASWIVSGKGPKRVSESGRTAADLPFSAQLQQKVLALSTPEIARLENVMRAHLGMAAISSTFTDEHRIPSGAKHSDAYAGQPEEGAGAVQEAELPVPKKDARRSKADRGHQRGQGGRRS